MKFVLNKCYGGWSLSNFAMETLGVSDRYTDLSPEQIDNLAELIEKHGSEACSGPFAKLTVVEIPDTFTDYKISDYDGIEMLTFVIDGKIYFA